MSFVAKLLFEDREINLLDFTYSFRQNIDYNGKPNSKIRLMGLAVVIEATKDSDILEWMLNPDLAKQIKIRIEPRSMNGKGRTIEFIDAHCVDYFENFDAKNTSPMTINLQIASAGFKEGAAEYQEYWRTTYPSTAVVTESSNEEDNQPRIVEYYITDANNKRIEETGPGETIFLVIDTRNLIGEKLTINLDDQTVDFVYGNETLVNDTLKDYEIGKNLEKIELKVIEQQN